MEARLVKKKVSAPRMFFKEKDLDLPLSRGLVVE